MDIYLGGVRYSFILISRYKKGNCDDVANDEMLSCVKRIQRDLADHVTADRR